jgi:hypothetical protein
MFGILVSAGMRLFSYILGSVIIKFVVFFALFFIVTEFTQILGGLLPSSFLLTSTLGGIPATVWYFLDLFNVSMGISVLLSAWVSRFIIRRIPVIG